MQTTRDGVAGVGGRGRGGKRGDRRAAQVRCDVPKNMFVMTLANKAHPQGSFSGTGGVLRLGEIEYYVVTRSESDAVHFRTYTTTVRNRPDEAIIGVHPSTNRVAIRLDNQPVYTPQLARQAQDMCDYARKCVEHDASVPAALRSAAAVQLPVVRAVFTAQEMQVPVDSPALAYHCRRARRGEFVPWNAEAQVDGLCVVREEIPTAGSTWSKVGIVPGARDTYQLTTWLDTEPEERPDVVWALVPYDAEMTPNPGDYVRAGRPLTNLRNRDIDELSVKTVVWQAFLAEVPFSLDVAQGGAESHNPPTHYESWNLVGVPLPFVSPLLRGQTDGPKPLTVVEDVRHMLGVHVANPAHAVLAGGFGPEMTDEQQRYVTLMLNRSSPVAQIAIANMQQQLRRDAVFATEDDIVDALLNPDQPMRLSGRAATYVANFDGMDTLRAAGLGVRADFGTRSPRYNAHGPLVSTGADSAKGDAAALSAAARRLADGVPVADVLGHQPISAAEAALALSSGIGS